MSEIVHQCPPRGSGLMPCCGRSPLETQGDRMTTNPDLVTCVTSWMVPTDQMLSIVDPPLISIMRADQNPLVTIHTDGRMEFGPDYEPDEAARVFWDAVHRLTPVPTDAVDNLRHAQQLEAAIARAHHVADLIAAGAPWNAEDTARRIRDALDPQDQP